MGSQYYPNSNFLGTYVDSDGSDYEAKSSKRFPK